MSSYPEVPSWDELARRIGEVESPRERAFFSMLYLTAGRITEILWSSRFGTPGVRPCDIRFMMHAGKEIMVVKIVNRKNRIHHEKELPVVVELEAPLVKFIRDYADSMPDKTASMFHFNAVTGWGFTRKHLGFTPHFLRHCRLTHLSAPPYRYDHMRLMKYAGWTNTVQADRYIHTRWDDFL
jgi:hypothetical protein